MAMTNAERQRRWRQKHREKNAEIQKQASRAYYQTPQGRALALWHSAKRRAENSGLKFNLTKSWIAKRLEVGVCEVTGIPFDLSYGDHTRNPFAPSIDRRNPKGNYTYQNCRLVVWVHNAARNEWGDDILNRYIKAMK